MTAPAPLQSLRLSPPSRAAEGLAAHPRWRDGLAAALTALTALTGGAALAQDAPASPADEARAQDDAPENADAAGQDGADASAEAAGEEAAEDTAEGAAAPPQDAEPAPDADDAPRVPFVFPEALTPDEFAFEPEGDFPVLTPETSPGLFGLPGASLGELLAPLEPGPDAPVERRLAWLFAELKIAPDAEEAAFVAEEIEALWRDVGDPTASLLTDRAAAAAAVEDLGLARRLADGAVELADASAEAWVRSAEIATLDGDVVRAVTDLEQALQIEPRRYDALLTLAALFEQLENWAGAYDAYEAVLEIYPQHPYAQGRRDDLEVRARGRAL